MISQSVLERGCIPHCGLQSSKVVLILVIMTTFTLLSAGLAQDPPKPKDNTAQFTKGLEGIYNIFTGPVGRTIALVVIAIGAIATMTGDGRGTQMVGRVVLGVGILLLAPTAIDLFFP